jgi:hypothetical protein
MIALTKYHETERLLALGTHSQRKIAMMVGISRATVGAIAAGKYHDRLERERARAQEYRPSGPLARCPGCGGMVLMPCLVCRVRSMKQQEQAVLRVRRRRAREHALRRLLDAVRKANWARDAREARRYNGCYFPPAADAAGPSDCK